MTVREPEDPNAVVRMSDIYQALASARLIEHHHLTEGRVHHVTTCDGYELRFSDEHMVGFLAGACATYFQHQHGFYDLLAEIWDHYVAAQRERRDD